MCIAVAGALLEADLIFLLVFLEGQQELDPVICRLCNLVVIISLVDYAFGNNRIS